MDDFRREVGHRFDKLDVRLDGMDSRLDGLDSRLDRLDSRLDGLDSRLDRLDSRLDGLHHAVTHGVIALSVSTLTGFAALVVLIATKL